jgi:hypothetical protein
MGWALRLIFFVYKKIKALLCFYSYFTLAFANCKARAKPKGGIKIRTISKSKGKKLGKKIKAKK